MALRTSSRLTNLPEAKCDKVQKWYSTLHRKQHFSTDTEQVESQARIQVLREKSVIWVAMITHPTDNH